MLYAQSGQFRPLTKDETMAQPQVDNMRSRLLNPSTPDPRGKATATPTANQLNKSGGRLKRPPSAATVAQQANGTDIRFDDGTFYAETLLDDSNGFVANKAKTRHTYHAVKKFELGDEAAPTRADGSQLIQSKHTLVFATPEYLAAKSKDAEVKRWRNLATAIGKGLADSSNKGVTIDDIVNWELGQRSDRRWLFKHNVVFHRCTDSHLKISMGHGPDLNFYPHKGTCYFDGAPKKSPHRGLRGLETLLREKKVIK
jgi:hypothetical protein